MDCKTSEMSCFTTCRTCAGGKGGASKDGKKTVDRWCFMMFWWDKSWYIFHHISLFLQVWKKTRWVPAPFSKQGSPFHFWSELRSARMIPFYFGLIVLWSENALNYIVSLHLLIWHNIIHTSSYRNLLCGTELRLLHDLCQMSWEAKSYKVVLSSHDSGLWCPTFGVLACAVVPFSWNPPSLRNSPSNSLRNFEALESVLQ